MSHKVDVAIIGGGASGGMAALHLKLAEPSLRVVIIERDLSYAIASTPRGSGGFRHLFSLPENIELSKYSVPFIKDLPQTLSLDSKPVDIGLQLHGYLFIVPHQDVRVLEENYERQRAMGCNVEWKTPSQLQETYPSMKVEDLAAGVFSPDDGWLSNLQVLQALNHKLRFLGVEFLEEEVAGFDFGSHRVSSVNFKSGAKVEAEHFVNAAGAWSGVLCELLGVSTPIVPLKRYEHYFEADTSTEQLPYIKDTAKLAFRPEGSGFSGGVPTFNELRGFHFSIDDSYFDAVVKPALIQRFQTFEKTSAITTRSGLYDQNDFDYSPIIGPGLGGLENFHMMSGFSGHGLMHSPGVGRAISELILTGAFQTMDLRRFGWQRILDNKPVKESGII